jgi:hypothetical protein
MVGMSKLVLRLSESPVGVAATKEPLTGDIVESGAPCELFSIAVRMEEARVTVLLIAGVELGAAVGVAVSVMEGVKVAVIAILSFLANS